MAEETGIEWCDSTFNPWMGCTKVSPACDHCYAEKLVVGRFKRDVWGPGKPRVRTKPANWKKPLAWNAARFMECASCGWRGECAAELIGCGRCGSMDNLRDTRRRVFCSSLADVFDNEVPDEWRADLFNLIADTPNLDWLLLTKRIGNARPMLGCYIASDGNVGQHWEPWPNVWIGATICNQEEADRDIPKLLATPAAVRFLSIEPMLGAVDLSPYVGYQSLTCEKCGPLSTDYAVFGATKRSRWHNCEDGIRRRVTAGPTIDWVIAGGESGHGARYSPADRFRSLRNQCAAAGVPFLFKQWGEFLPDSQNPKMEQPQTGTGGIKVGKAAAGRLLDGRTHDGFPESRGMV